MNGTGETTIAVLAGLAAAGSFGAGVALQHRQAQLAPRAHAAPLRLVGYLARRRLWLAGIALAAGGYGLQALALTFGPLTLVAPLAATDLLFALPLAARWSRRPLRRLDWAGCSLVGGGIAVFLAVAPPGSGHSDASARDWLLAFAAVAVASGAAVTAGLLGRAAARPALLAVAAGTIFGLTAAVTLSLTRLLRHVRPGSVPGHWQLWAVLALGGVGLLLSLAAFQAGPLSASLPVVATVEPVSAVLVGTLVFGEPLAASAAGLGLQLAGAAGALAGIVLLGRSPVTAGASSQVAAEQPQAAAVAEPPREAVTVPDDGRAGGGAGLCRGEQR